MSNSNTPKPFDDVFNGTIQMRPNKNSRNQKGLIWKKSYNVRIIKASHEKGKGVKFNDFFSDVELFFKDNYGHKFFEYNKVTFQLLDEEMANLLKENGFITALKEPYTDNPDDVDSNKKWLNKIKGTDAEDYLPFAHIDGSLKYIGSSYLPYLYNKGSVPADYDEKKFDEKKVWNGQRFVFIWNAEEVIFNSSNWKIDWLDFNKLWAGLTAGVSANYLAAGVHAQFGAILNTGELFASIRSIRTAGMVIHGWSLGPGFGASGGLNLVFFINYEDYPDMKSYGSFSFDWDLAMGSNVKGAGSYLRLLFKRLRALQGKNVKKLGSAIDVKDDMIKKFISLIIKNYLGNDFFDKKFEIVIPVPFLNGGLHWFVGAKNSKFDSFPEKIFGSRMAKQK